MAAGSAFPRSLVVLAVRPTQRAFSLSQASEAPITAEQLVEKMRARKQRQQKPQNQVPEDPVQRRVKELKQFSQQLQRVHPTVLAKNLKRGIVFQDKDIVVINKPYGIPVHGGPKVKICITDVLPILSKMLFGMKAEPLHLCHRLDKETTGVMVLARDEDVAGQIHDFFRTRKVEKKYWAICVGQPEPTEGLVDIPIMEKEVESNQHHFKMTLAPKYRIFTEEGKISKTRQHRDAQLAATRYCTLSSHSSSSLLELQPITGIKHQLRVHVAYGLGCPILGDHKYSHWNKLAPQLDEKQHNIMMGNLGTPGVPKLDVQVNPFVWIHRDLGFWELKFKNTWSAKKLPVGALKRLGLVQAKARHIPLHLHACKLTLPELNGSKEKKIHLVCKPPHFFNLSLSRLKLERPKLEEQ